MATSTKPAKTTATRAKRDLEGLERVGASLDEVQTVLVSMRSNVSSGAHDRVDDVDRMVKDARRDLSGLTKALHSDVDDLQKAVRRPPAPRKAKPARAKPRKAKAAAGSKS